MKWIRHARRVAGSAAILTLVMGCGASKGDVSSLEDKFAELEGKIAALETELKAADSSAAGRLDSVAASAAQLRTDVDAAETAHSALDTKVTTLSGDHDALAGTVATLKTELQGADDDLTSRLDAVADEAITAITADRTISVPADYATVAEALESLDKKRIVRATVTIQLADGTYDFDSTIVVDHPDGGRIHIVGNDADPSQVELHYTGTEQALNVPRSGGLGLLSGVTITGTNTAGTLGITVGPDGHLIASDIEVSGFGGSGLYVLGGWVEATGAVVTANGAHGILVQVGGTVLANEVTLTHNGLNGITADQLSMAFIADATVTDNTGLGALVYRGSYVAAPRANIEDNGMNGVNVDLGGIANLSEGTLLNNGKTGVSIGGGGMVDVRDGVISGNAENGIFAATGSVVYAHRATVEDNLWHGVASFSNATLVAPSAVVNGNGGSTADPVYRGWLGTWGAYLERFGATGDQLDDVNINGSTWVEFTVLRE